MTSTKAFILALVIGSVLGLVGLSIFSWTYWIVLLFTVITIGVFFE